MLLGARVIPYTTRRSHLLRKRDEHQSRRFRGHLRVGYNRAARMIEAMEASGVVGPLENGRREVFAPAPVE